MASRKEIRVRPSISIYFQSDFRVEQRLKEIRAGIEEEGVFFSVNERKNGTVQELAQEAARDSFLEIGIGLVGEAVEVTIPQLKKDQPLFSLRNPTKAELRRLGTNVARYVKGLPFQMEEERL